MQTLSGAGVGAQNAGQGLGFKVAGKVIDTKTMRKFAIQLYTGLATLITALLALQTPHGGIAGEACSLSSTQAGSIRAAMAPWRNSSCVYNKTLETILGMA